MDISIQNLSRPAQLPGVLPLQYLTPAQIGAPSNGIEASRQGAALAQAELAPVTQTADYLTQYYLPENVAKRKAEIAQAGLQTTNATQEDQAAQQTPSLPLAGRQLALAQTQAQQGLVQPTAALQHATIDSSLQKLPSETGAAIASNTQIQQANTNKVNSTPNLPAPGIPEPESAIAANVGATNNALANAKFERSVAIAGNPYLASNADGSAAIPEGHYISGGKMMEDTVTQRQIQGDDGKAYIQNVWAHSGQPVSYLENQLSGQNVRTDAANQRQDKMINSHSVNYGTPDNPVTLSPGDANEANRTISYFRTRPDVTGITKVAPIIQKAYATIEAGKDAQTGVPSVDSMLTAARIFRGSNVTDSEMRALDSAGGIKQKLFQIVNSWDGKQYDLQTMNDLTNAITLANQSGQDYLGKIKQDFTDSLPDAAIPVADRLFNKVAHLTPPASSPTSVPKGGPPGASAPAPTTQAEYDAIPSGTTYLHPDGTYKVKP